MRILSFLYFLFFRLLFFVFFFGSLTCKGQESDGTPTAQAPDTKHRSTEPPKGTIQQIEMAEKPFVGYAFYDDEGKRVKLTNIRLFTTLNPFNNSEFYKESQGYMQINEDKNNDTLNAVIKFDFTKEAVDERASFIKKYINKDVPTNIINTFDAIISMPNSTWLSGSRHQFLIVTSTANFIRSDTTIWCNTYISVYDCNGLIKYQTILNNEANKIEISDDGKYLLSEIIKRYYGDEEYYEFVELLISDLINNNNKIVKPDISGEISIDQMRYDGQYFNISINKYSPMGSMYLMLVDPYQRKVFEKQVLLKSFNEWSPLKLPDGSKIDLRNFKESDF